MSVVETRYAVEGWGVGEVWSRDGLVLAHSFEFAAAGAVEQFASPSGDAAVADLVERVREFLAGGSVSFDDVELDLDDCTPFERSVTEALRAVPRGSVVTYGELAALAGHPGAARAAGTVCAHNRFAFVVPCHRVVAADGIGGYGATGIGVKRRLLELEGAWR